MALCLIGNIWAAVAAWMLAEGSEQKGFVQECAGRGAARRQKAEILSGESLMHIPAFFPRGEEPPRFLPPRPRACNSSKQDSSSDQRPATSAVWKSQRMHPEHAEPGDIGPLPP